MHTGKEAVAYEKLRIRGVRLPDGENEVFFVCDSHIFSLFMPAASCYQQDGGKNDCQVSHYHYVHVG